MRKESLKRDNTTDSSQGDNSDADDNEQSLSNGRNEASNGTNGDGIDPFDALVASKPPSSSKPNSVAAGSVSPVNSPSSSPTNDAPNNTDGDADAAAEVADEDGGYEVESIVDHQYKGKSKKLYKIRWKNYGPDDDTWEPEDSLSCPELIEKYLETHPDTRPPKKEKKEKKEKKPKKEKPVVDAVPRDTPKRASAKNSIVESDDGGASVDSTRKSKKAGPKKANKGKKANPVYDVEKIIEHRSQGGETIFRIRWKGYRADQDTWEPKSALSCNDLIKKYWATNKKKGVKPVEFDPNVEYDVEKIVGHKVEKNQVFYWVKWKGYGEDANTWELANTVHCPDLIEQYKSKYFGAPASSGKPKAALKRPAVEPKKITTSPAKKKKKAPKIVPDDSSDDADNDEDDDADDENADKDPLGELEKEWEVEQIVDSRDLKGKKEYLIRWKGCKSDQDTWEPAHNVNCPDIIAKFEKKQGAAAKKPAEKQGKRVSIKLPSTPRKSSRRA